jgi:DNA-binding GntR family transcriptional regulator
MNKNEIVKNYIKTQISKKIYSEGQIIESENCLCELLNVSRMTVRKALDALVNEGIVYKEKGRGTFVAKKPKYSEFKLGVSFTQEAIKRGMIPSSKDNTLELCEANEEVSKILNISIGTKVWKVTRVRCANDIPIIYISEYYLYSLCPDLNEEIIKHSIYKYLATKNIHYTFLDQKLNAVSCTKDIAKKLNIEEGYPLIKMSLVTYMKNGIAFNCGNEYYVTDTYTLIQSIYNEDVI